MNSVLLKTSNFVSGYGTRDAFFRTIQCAAKLVALLTSNDDVTKKQVLMRIVTLLGTSRKYFAIGNVLKEMNNFKITLDSSYENPEFFLRILKSGGMLGFFAMDNLNAITSLTSNTIIPYTSPIGNLSFLVAVLSSIGLEYIKEEQDEPLKRYIRYVKIATELIIALNSLGLIKLPEEFSTLMGLVSAGLCCVESLQ
ncbi:hypothetical protein EHI8A_120450 [Entamoeba histolytica HM-1:IMSS-B]|uniref:Uncharacterized protein n=5 Tax=Entamoeba histolytica TaxID=5759 RepID=C4LVJ1_ENTH1|nr:hypothetical protein EHI_103470 [Entamoeba histolytica HM-1:IMSS]EMH76987.1 hypothetical protein EHI8A_120450 [Entamoeba histolytica HM-1:IMSS-B]EMS13422.1 hypothetical protein KM1_070230 [Entamoeba histolytica HM-3:IMSS]ENY64838.1 hypothetical protein EHI7A_111510 [Entamoeba histolytica HM-1:IMSS-A]GAT92688.1 hypothetical protein CL6EHI_103470 [Entamoeba histolytica]EAL47031.1 hypothetical protein EHI_103470 [Entamoeba histolytica HM-1:IMSS]|eukprot:XP_652417.1 hypothetical protein EHI_103470 [Entamoeba histolytica HM-1:IMSS]